MCEMVIRARVIWLLLPINFRFAPKADLIANTGGDSAQGRKRSACKSCLLPLNDPT